MAEFVSFIPFIHYNDNILLVWNFIEYEGFPEL